MMNKEIWKDIKGYEGLYQISNFGRVKSLPKMAGKSPRKEQILKNNLDRYGYYFVALSKYGVRNNKLIHRLVAEAFINNPNNYLQINHKDENKLNNCVNNLEWCTTKYNINYGNRTKKVIKKLSKKVSQYNSNGKYIKTYNSISEASRKCNISQGSICSCCKNKLKQSHGFIWKYVEVV